MPKTDSDAAEAPVAASPASVLDEASRALQETTHQLVRRWVDENLVHGRIARDVELWNELQAALPALVDIITS